MIMQEGYLTLTWKNSEKLTDADILQAKKEGYLNQLLESLDTDFMHGPQHNLINQSFAAFMFMKLFSASLVGGDWIKQDYSDPAFLGSIVLSSQDDEPVVTEWVPGASDWDFWTPISSAWTGGIASKRFEEDASELAQIISDTNGRESISYRERFCFGPSEAVSSNIRTFGIVCVSTACQAVNGSGANKGVGGRIRLKDSNGLPVIYSKASNQILTAEYKFILASV